MSRTMERLFGQDNIPFSVTWTGAGTNPTVTRNYNGDACHNIACAVHDRDADCAHSFASLLDVVGDACVADWQDQCTQLLAAI